MNMSMLAEPFLDGTGSSAHGCRGAGPWRFVRVPVVVPDGWLISELHEGIRELERIRRETDAATAVLVNALPVTRDSAAGLARCCGISLREARNRQVVAAVVGKVQGVRELLASGVVSSEHVKALAPVVDSGPVVEDLLRSAGLMSPEELVEAVERKRIELLGHDDAAKRQRERRRLRFFNGPDGMVGLTGLFPPVDGMTLKNKLTTLVDKRWRAAHPYRARVLGGHGGDTYEQRMADALLELTGIRTYAPNSAESGAQYRNESESEPGSEDGRKHGVWSDDEDASDQIVKAPLFPMVWLFPMPSLSTALAKAKHQVSKQTIARW